MKKASFNRDQGGLYLVMVAISIIALILLCGLAVDGSNLFLAQLRLQRVVDAAALRALKLRDSMPNSFVENATVQLVKDALSQMGYTYDIAPTAPCTAQGNDITAQINVPIYLMKIVPGLEATMPISAVASAGVPPMVVELILDTTDSMNRTIPCASSLSGCVKGVELKRAAKEFVDGMDESGRDYLGLTSFGSVTMPPVLTPAPVTPAYKTFVKSKIDSIVFSQATCISCGLEKGLLHINDTVAHNSFRIPPKKFAVLFTDGSPNANNGGSSLTPMPFKQCWDNSKVMNNDIDDPQPIWGLYSGDFDTTRVKSNPPTSQMTNANDASTIWETIASANKLAKANVTTYVIGLTTRIWRDGFITGCHDSSPESPCPSYLLDVDTPYTGGVTQWNKMYSPHPFNPYPDPYIYTQQFGTDGKPYPKSVPLYGRCPDTAPAVEIDPFHACYFDYNPVLLRRIANDKAMAYAEGYPDPVFPYRPDAPPQDFPLSSFCASNPPATHPDAWKCGYWDACTHAVGPSYPEGEALITPDPSELPAKFADILQKIRSKARLLP